MSKTLSFANPIRIFIGSSPKNKIEEQVLRYTIYKYTPHPVEVQVFDGTTGAVKNLMTGEVRYIPDSVISRIKGGTAFSLARWAIPQLCGFTGKAIYCDSDQLALADLEDLWNEALGDCAIAVVPVDRAVSYPHYIETTLKKHILLHDRRYLASVMLMDCSKANWTMDNLVERLDNHEFSLAELMFLGQGFRQAFNIQIKDLDPAWNHLDYYDRTSKLVHFTDLTSQPWVCDHNPIGFVWDHYLLEAINRGYVTQADLQQSYANHWVNRRIVTFPFLPKGLRRPMNAIWRTWNAAGFRLNHWLNEQMRSLKTLKSTVKQSMKAIVSR